MQLSIESVSALRVQLWDAGFRPIPILNADAPGPSPGKRPLGEGWREAALKEPPFCVTVEAVSHALNTGILGDGLRAIDFDIDDPELMMLCRAMAVDRFGEAPIRMRGNSPRCLLLYRAASGTPPKIVITGKEHSRTIGRKIEVLGAGQQFVAFGRHDSGADLEWFPEPPGEVTLDSLPVVTEDQIYQYLTDAAVLIGAAPPIRANGVDHHPAADPQADPLRLAAAMAAIPNTGPADWEAWNRIGMALFRATGGSDLGSILWDEWSRRNAAYSRAETEERWHNYYRSPPTELGAGSIFHAAGATFHPEPLLEEPPAYFDDPAYFASVELNAPVEEQLPPPEPQPRETDPTVIFDPWNALQPVRFPMEALPATLARFVESRSTVMGADPCALAWACISACSAAIHGETRLLMKRHDTWSVPAAIWLALVGLPSTLKTPIITTAWHPLSQIQEAELRAWTTEHDVWAALPRKTRDTTTEPHPKRRLITHDATIEGLQSILARQSRGIGVLRDELSGWIGSMEKYAPGKGGAADRAFWLQSYNGGGHVVDRVIRGTLSIANLLATVCGGIQPDRLRTLGDITDDGLWQRLIAIIVAASKLGQDRPPGTAEEEYNRMVVRLITFTGPRVYRLSEEAHAIREHVQHYIHRLEMAEVLGTRFTGFVGKMAGLWGRLSLVLHLTVDPTQTEIPESIAKAAWTLMERSILPNAARVYMAMGAAGGDIEATQSIAGYILTKRLSRVRLSDLTSNVRVCRHRGADDVRKLLSPLQAGGWLLPEKEYNPTAWAVSEFVHQRFAHHAARETERRELVRAVILSGAGSKGGEDGDQ